ncbi:MAG: VWA domain-containing protein, partial [Nitrospinae bacterium]|nr:VWA domain-containing protein [Nitrospinota bacterium]
MDDSGSMRKTDPLNLRLSALALLIRLLRDDDAVGIVKFDEGAQVVVPLDPIGAEKDRRALYKADTAFSARGAYTNIYTGLKTALQEMQQRARDNTEKAVVLISDGLMDVNPASGVSNEDVLRALHSALLPEYKEARVKIITLALSPAADRSLLLAIAAVTDGRYFYTPKAEDLSQAIFGIFDELKAPEMVPLKGQRAILDASVKEATFFIATDVSKGGVALVRPDGARLERSRQDPTAKWFVGKDYVLCTIQRPMVGEWRVE